MGATDAGVELDPVMSRSESDVYRFGYDQDETPVNLAVVAALSEVIGVDPIDLEPLHTTVDTDALGILARVRATTTGDVHVTFSHEGHDVTVHSYGIIAVARSGDEHPEDRDEDVVHT